MPRSLRAVAALFALLGSAETAGAAALPFEAELEIHFGTGTAAPFPFVGLTGTGVATVNGAGPGGPLATLALPAGFLVGSAVQVVTDPAAAPVRGLLLDVGNDAGQLTRGGGALRGTMGLPGSLKVCLFEGCGAAVANLVVPMTHIGVGGTMYATPGAVNLTVIGAPWTTGTVMLGSFATNMITITGSAQGPASAPNSTALPGGSLSLVTPMVIRTSANADGPAVGLGVLHLHFVPEPASLLLIGVGVAALAAMGRTRG